MDELEKRLRPYVTVQNNAMILGLDRVKRLLADMGNPQLSAPPIIHVAGTNGKGSTIAFMRAMLEAAGKRVHVFTSPHLIHFNERIRLAGQLVDDELLLKVVREIAAVNGDQSITFFELITVAAFVLFARVRADILLLEVGLGGRLDSTNVVVPAVSVITRISYDHMHLLGKTLEQIAGEKACIIKPGVPCVIGYQADAAVQQVFRARAKELNAPLYEYGHDFSATELSHEFIYRARDVEQTFPLPALLGAHQILNAATAITAVKLFTNLNDENIRAGLATVEWPGRLEHITNGPIAELLPFGWELWYDGAHNDSGAEAVAEQCRRWRAQGYEIHLIMGMLATKDPAVFKAVAALSKTITTIPIQGDTPAYSAAELAVKIGVVTDKAVYKAASIQQAIHHIIPAIKPAKPQLVLVCGSLHLAQSLA